VTYSVGTFTLMSAISSESWVVSATRVASSLEPLLAMPLRLSYLADLSVLRTSRSKKYRSALVMGIWGHNINEKEECRMMRGACFRFEEIVLSLFFYTYCSVVGVFLGLFPRFLVDHFTHEIRLQHLQGRLDDMIILAVNSGCLLRAKDMFLLF